MSVNAKPEVLENENFKELEFILKKPCSIGFLTFYLQLFLNSLNLLHLIIMVKKISFNIIY